ncbi:DctP family TRAP transporter solute-binding subunit [Dethiobacter alkaliphilus]|uniref:TRAP dicarboxylate transporter, DctP subunit n=1 Tax=Dethiobacter alkaliphilus AHT 1 TaxID=555088 RepID=C0GIJ7_DETAL|nr:DctP family TRAP transporter solute-binding subunit [Dethiobacter alkaliphilus]EEG76858.1 TRAP dicarboxylate transporter, DctP subunit [Dethiobacter alkaliphilus AHT 1]
MQTITTSKLLYALLLTVMTLALLLSGCQNRALDLEQVGEDERIVIKFSHVVSELTPKGLAARRFAELVHERTDGLVEVQVYPNSQLYMDGEEVDALINNNVQMIAPATAKMTEFFPELLLFDLPFLFEDFEQVHRFIDSEGGQKLLDKFQTDSMLSLAMWDNGFKVMTANRPLYTPDDFAGLRFRIMPSRVLEAQFAQLGAQTRDMPFSDVYAALERGTVNAAENPPSNLYSKRFYMVQEHLTVSNHGYLGYLVLTNQTFWQGLPEDIREILEETLAEVTQWERKIAAEQNKRDLERIINSGEIEVHYLSEAEKAAWREALMPVHQMFLPDIGTELLQGTP